MYTTNTCVWAIRNDNHDDDDDHSNPQAACNHWTNDTPLASPAFLGVSKTRPSTWKAVYGQAWATALRMFSRLTVHHNWMFIHVLLIHLQLIKIEIYDLSCELNKFLHVTNSASELWFQLVWWLSLLPYRARSRQITVGVSIHGPGHFSSSNLWPSFGPWGWPATHGQTPMLKKTPNALARTHEKLKAHSRVSRVSGYSSMILTEINPWVDWILSKPRG